MCNYIILFITLLMVEISGSFNVSIPPLPPKAVRKAPTPAIGFRVAASKWLILVRLLLGEVPERQEFALPGLGKALQPYLELTQAVRSGDLVAFAKASDTGGGVIAASRYRNPGLLSFSYTRFGCPRCCRQGHSMMDGWIFTYILHGTLAGTQTIPSDPESALFLGSSSDSHPLVWTLIRWPRHTASSSSPMAPKT